MATAARVHATELHLDGPSLVMSTHPHVPTRVPVTPAIAVVKTDVGVARVLAHPRTTIVRLVVVHQALVSSSCISCFDCGHVLFHNDDIRLLLLLVLLRLFGRRVGIEITGVVGRVHSCFACRNLFFFHDHVRLHRLFGRRAVVEIIIAGAVHSLKSASRR